MEHVRFATPLRPADILALARATPAGSGVALRPGGQPIEQLVGVSDGRYPAEATLCFVDRAPEAAAVAHLQRALVATTPALAPALPGASLLIAADPRALFIDLVARLATHPGFACFTTLVPGSAGIDATAEVHPSAVIEDGVRIGPGARIAAGCVVKRGCVVGEGAVVRENTVIGGRGIALYKSLDGRVLRFPDLAGVIVEASVEIGTSCSLPSGVLTSTVIGRDSVIGNLCNIGHGAKIGARVWMSVGTLVGGNATIGDGSTLGLGVCVRDNIRIGSNCSIGMGSVIMRHVPDGASMLGNPARALPKVDAGPQR
jgi:UDP-3-O-[3-hydroxymyristoyl] glucosamine N-acyltransferase